MTDAEAKFQALMQRLRKGSQDAAWQLIEIYAPHIRAVVRRQLGQQLREWCESEDFVQAVWVSMFRNPGGWERMENSDQFVAWLAALARNKVVDEVRRQATAKHDARRRRSLEDDELRQPGIPAQQATPSAFAMARERWSEMIRQQTERDRRILQLRLSGATYGEIARQMNINERTARRVVTRLLDLGTAES